MGRPTDIARNNRMVSMYRQGVTLQKIGDQFGVSRERVRQILRWNGVDGKDGGQALCVAAKREQRSNRLEARYMLKYGQPVAVVRELQKARITHAFAQQKTNAVLRAIDWRLTFAQWFAIWQTSGKIEQRGKGIGKYVMSRINDNGAYELGNVHIELATQNSRDAVKKWLGKEKANRGVYLLYPGGPRPWHARVGKKSLGSYATEAEAVAARSAYIENTPGAFKVRGYSQVKSKSGGPDRFQVMVGSKYIGSYRTPEDALAARAAYLDSRRPELVA